ncbi:M50 family metallopeptidase [Shewanella algidipiscicola]|uniref:Membrane zinc metalloprotease n=1 Tax=Shewanella algidipiscicola TaxID=614070 RepID=A0ABQ4P677_9GAMM|nr:M50 family metallopeptidase [Shewanella algidipiscicola]GIU43026.1 membrane zinc metalloprotease [Shewanella algidipiscicola]
MAPLGQLPAPSAISIPSRGQFIVELLLALVLTRIPYISVPFKWLESYFHEISHGLATLITGGVVSHIQLFPNGAGLCFSQGGWPVVIGFAGYFGAALWGLLIFNLATWRQWIRLSFAVLGLAVLLTMLLWGRDLLTLGILSLLALLFLLPLKLSHSPILTLSLRVMALMVMLNALASPTVLFGLTGLGDAAMLAQLTWLPAVFWVTLWVLTSLLMLWLCWRRIDDAAK